MVDDDDDYKREKKKIAVTRTVFMADKVELNALREREREKE